MGPKDCCVLVLIGDKYAEIQFDHKKDVTGIALSCCIEEALYSSSLLLLFLLSYTLLSVHLCAPGAMKDMQDSS